MRLKHPGPGPILLCFLFFGAAGITPLCAKESVVRQETKNDATLAQLLITLKDPFVSKLPQVRKIVPARGKPIFIPQNPAHPEARAQVTKPDFRIAGLVWNSHRPQAIINGQVVSIGDTLNGWVVSQITKKGVEITSEGATFFIEP